jgi:hypothetical protein
MSYVLPVSEGVELGGGGAFGGRLFWLGRGAGAAEEGILELFSEGHLVSKVGVCFVNVKVSQCKVTVGGGRRVWSDLQRELRQWRRIVFVALQLQLDGAKAGQPTGRRPARLPKRLPTAVAGHPGFSRVFSEQVEKTSV